MIVPFSKQDQAQRVPTPKVSEAQLLMALATMHSQGKLSGEAVREGSGSPTGEAS